jgi:outer membrane protein assembly factor BamB
MSAAIGRWYPLVLILLAGWACVGLIQFTGFTFIGRPMRELAGVIGLTNVAAYIWVRRFSRVPLRLQITAIMAGFALQMGLYFVTRIDGFMGDGRPIFVWRWKPTAEQQWSIAKANVTRTHSTDDAPAAVARSNGFDSPSFRGSDRSGKYAGLNWSRDWSRPPRLLWKHPVGQGWSSFAVVGDRCFTQEQRGVFETVVCYGLRTGTQIWEHQDETCFKEVTGGKGTRATPTVDGGRVYTIGATGILNCLSADTGERTWSTNVLDDGHVENRLFGMAGSPLVTGGLVIVCPGGKDSSLVAYDRETGTRIWGAGDAEASYSSPNYADFRPPQVLLFNADGLFGHDAKSGQVLWKYDWVSNPAEKNNICQPVPLPGKENVADRVFVSSGYGKGCALFEIVERDEHFDVQRLWGNQNLKAKFSSVVLQDGCVYGLDDQILVCIDVATGRRLGKGGRYGYGQLVLIGDLLLIQAESGEVALVDATSEAHRELGRFTALDGKTWNHPVVAGRFLLVRNDREAACYELPLEPAK